MDKWTLEEMKDPRIHLLRNCIGHGLEKPEQRQARKRPATGHITLLVRHKDSGRIEVVIEDGGTGIDPQKVRAAAVKLGIKSPAESQELSEEETLSLVFRSRISTNP